MSAQRHLLRKMPALRRLTRWMQGLCLALCLASCAPQETTQWLLPAAIAETATPIKLGSDPSQDAQIEKRMLGIYQQLDRFKAVTVSVSGGIVSLAGEVDSLTAEARAVELARQVEGVVDVENSLTVSRDVQERIETTSNQLMTQTRGFVQALPLYALALVALIAVSWFGRLLAHHNPFIKRIAPNAFIASLLRQITQLIFILLGLVLALTLLDATAIIGTVLGAAGIVGLAVGFAVKDTVENYIASILLSLKNPFEPNDFVKIDNYEGAVARLTARATILISPDGNQIRIPNAMVFKAVITNFTRNPERRYQFDLRVSKSQDLANAQALVLQTLSGIAGVLDKPAPQCVVDSIDDSAAVLGVYAWVNQTNVSILKVRSESIRLVKEVLDGNSVNLSDSSYRLLLSTEHAAMLGSDHPAEARQQDMAAVKKSRPAATGDLSVDDAVAQQVAQEQAQANGDNLLSQSKIKE